MRTPINRRSSRRQRSENHNRSETAVATIWLAFYAIALGVAIASPFVSHAIEVSTR
ncbi:MAG: hypothetical protein WBG10_05405 [Pseudolabrys sp.]